MKTIVTSCILLFFILPSVLAQTRFSVAPTYWFNHGIYTYRVQSVYDGLAGNSSGYSNGSSVGLTARYHFQTNWSLSVGVLYNQSISHVTVMAPQHTTVRLSSEYIQVPVFVNYRLTTHSVSPYFSAGVFLEKNKSNTQDPFKTNAVIGAGLDFRINSKLSLLAQPTGSYLLHKPADNGLIHYENFNSYRFGIQTQAIWHF